MKIYDYSKDLCNEEIIKKIYEFTSFLNSIYPNYSNWFIKHVKECHIGERNILYTLHNNEISGVIFLKNDQEEAKICTLYINPKYRNNHIATSLIEASFKFLETTKPYATVNENKIDMFNKLLERYNWEITDKLIDCYKKGENELVLNYKKKIK